MKNKCVALFDALETWHRRLGHASFNTVKQILKECNVHINRKDDFAFCDAFQLGKLHKLPFPQSVSCVKGPLDLIHTDVWGPAPIQCKTGFKYYISFVDDHNKFTWLYPLRTKGEALSAFIQFKKLVENQFQRTIKIVQNDWGSEFRSFTMFCQILVLSFSTPVHTSLSKMAGLRGNTGI